MAEATVIESGSPAASTGKDRATEIAVYAAWEMEALIMAAKQALERHDMIELTLRGLLARMNQLNGITISALSDEAPNLDELEHVVCDAGIGLPKTH